jgi:hypothetical protein
VPDFPKVTENRLRQYIDAQFLIRARADALKDAAQVRGSMIWREMRGVRYLIRTSAASARKTIRPDSEVICSTARRSDKRPHKLFSGFRLLRF